MDRVGLFAAVFAALALGACGDNEDPFAGLVRVSGASPFTAGCGGPQPGINYPGVEVEPSLAVDPTDARHMIGVWQQDRWSNGGANGLVTATSFDGGASWTHSLPHFSACTGGDYERSTDPWVTFGPDGTAYQIALGFDHTTARHAVLASQSDDGGITWSEPATLRADADSDVFNDKESITADPIHGGLVYAVWDRLTGLDQPKLPTGTGPTWFARLIDGGWEPSRVIYDPGLDAQTIGNVIVVLPDGTLIDMFDQLTMNSGDQPAGEIAVIRSTDQGDTWSPPVVVTTPQAVGVRDPNNELFIRAGTELPAITVDPANGAVYVVWQDSRFSDGVVDGIALSRSRDGGTTWSAPVEVDQARGSGAFLPTVAVAADGTVGVSYFDLRDAVVADRSSFRATAWLTTSSDGGDTWSEHPLTEPFDLRSVVIGTSYFLGDYQALAVSGNELVPFFVAATTESDVFVRPVR